MSTIALLYRYPVKGLSAEALTSVAVMPGETLPNDRAYAIENGRSKFDPAAPRWLPKANFLMLMKNERLALLSTRFDDATATLTIRLAGEVVVKASLATEHGCRAVEAFFDAFAADDLRGPAKVLNVPGYAFTDVPEKCLSLVNLASLRDLERHVGGPVHPLRFRANLYVDGLAAWEEFDWIGKEIDAGGVRLRATGRINRCAATNVDPATARRDRTIPDTLHSAYGHSDCGIYVEVLGRGELRLGALVEPQ